MMWIFLVPFLTYIVVRLRYTASGWSRMIAVASGFCWWTGYMVALTVCIAAAIFTITLEHRSEGKISLPSAVCVAVIVSICRVAYRFWGIYRDQPNEKVLNDLEVSGNFGDSDSNSGKFALTLAAGPITGGNSGLNGLVGTVTGILLAIFWCISWNTPTVVSMVIVDLSMLLDATTFLVLGWPKDLNRCHFTCCVVGVLSALGAVIK